MPDPESYSNIKIHQCGGTVRHWEQDEKGRSILVTSPCNNVMKIRVIASSGDYPMVYCLDGTCHISKARRRRGRYGRLGPRIIITQRRTYQFTFIHCGREGCRGRTSWTKFKDPIL